MPVWHILFCVWPLMDQCERLSGLTPIPFSDRKKFVTWLSSCLAQI